MVIGVTDEAVSTVDSWFAKAQPRYPIVILEDKSFEKALGAGLAEGGRVVFGCQALGKVAHERV